jgi:hypothetical protein
VSVRNASESERFGLMSRSKQAVSVKGEAQSYNGTMWSVHKESVTAIRKNPAFQSSISGPTYPCSLLDMSSNLDFKDSSSGHEQQVLKK